MKEATGEVSMTVVTLVAIGVIGAILALFWQPIADKISGLWGTAEGSTYGSAGALGSVKASSKKRKTIATTAGAKL